MGKTIIYFSRQEDYFNAEKLITENGFGLYIASTLPPHLILSRDDLSKLSLVGAVYLPDPIPEEIPSSMPRNVQIAARAFTAPEKEGEASLEGKMWDELEPPCKKE